MKRWCLVGAVSLLAGCGLFQVRVNGEVKTLGGSSEGEQKEEEAKEGGDSSSKSASKGSAEKGGNKGESDKERDESLRKATKEIRAALDKHVMEDPGPLPAAKLGELAAKKKEFAAAGLEAEAHYLTHLTTYYEIENGWRGDAAKSGDVLAGLLGGKAHAQGELTGKDKPQSFKFKAEEGKCYTVLLRMKSAGGEEDKMTEFFLDAGKDNSSLQRFDMDQRRTRGAGLMRQLSKSYTRGACALKTTEVTGTVEMKYAGTQNGLRYVVVETPREKLSQYIALEMQPRLADSCDVDGWTNMWTNPLPSSVLYGSDAPFIPYEVRQAEEMWMTAWSAENGEVRVKRKDLSSAAPKQLKFDDKPRFRGCPKELKYAHSADGLKVAQCYDRLNKKFDPQFDAAQKARNNAAGILAEIAADRRMTQLNNQYADEEERTCKKIEADVAKKFDAAYNKIVDFYRSTPVKNTFDRGTELKLSYDGSVAIGCVGQYSCSP
ncbi:MAG: hypothetical protein HOW73_24435 [Polyangiaceae bacterium]|nr:hypothetical protein [Polyangiaceae bacterium]